MQGDINKKRVMIEVLEPEPVVLLIRRKKFIKARVLQVGSLVRQIKADDLVMSYNEGVQVRRGDKNIRIVIEEAVVLKFT